MRKQRWLTIIILLLALAAPTVAFGQDTTFYFISATNPSSLTAPFQTATASFSLRKFSATGTYPYYYLVADATLGAHEAGLRKLYMDGNQNEDSIPIYLRPKNETQEIGVDNVAETLAVPGLISGTATSTVEFDVVLGSPVGLVSDGTYTNTFTFNLYTNRASGAPVPLSPPEGESATRLIGTRSITITATVNFSIVTLSLSTGNVSFDTSLVHGGTYETENISLTAQATRRFNLHVNSANKGVLKLSDSEFIPYSYTFGGAVVDLGTGTVLLQSDVRRGTYTYSMNFRIEDIPFVEGGVYQDILTFFISIP